VECLVTGGTGSLGRHLVRRLAAEGAVVRVFARASSRREAIASCVSRWHEGDLLDAGSLRRACAGADVVFHLAARVDFRRDDPLGMRCVNVEGTRLLLDAAAAAGARVVHVSTVGAVGASRVPAPLDESVEWNLGRFGIPYFDTKKAAEDLALERARSGSPVVVVNPSITIAPLEPSRRLRMWPARLAAGRLPPVSVRSGVNLVDQRDAAATIAAAAGRGRPGERYLVTGHDVTVDELMALVASITRGRAPRWHVPVAALVAAAGVADAAARMAGARRRFHPGLARLAGWYWFYDDSKARRELGHSVRPLGETLEEMVRSARAGPAP
jgi:dihydroflavonol-4-reductase